MKTTKEEAIKQFQEGKVNFVSFGCCGVSVGRSLFNILNEEHLKRLNWKFFLKSIPKGELVRLNPNLLS